MVRRKILFDTYDTAADGLWTLADWSLSAAEPVVTLVDIPGRIDGPIDVSEALTGDVQYKTRTLEATLESSEGTRLERKGRIDDIINQLHGQRVKIWLPDDEGHFLLGRLKVKEQYNDLAHAAVKVTATCEPWRYATEETAVTVVCEGDTQEVTLVNDRRRTYPTATVQGDVMLAYNGSAYALGEGTYLLTDIPLGQGERTITVSGTGSVTFTYRRAVL